MTIPGTMTIQGTLRGILTVGLTGAAWASTAAEEPRRSVEAALAQAPARRFVPLGGPFRGRFVGVSPRSGDSRVPQASRREIRLYRSAMQQLEADRPDEAIVYLQAILDADTDGFFESEEQSGRFVSLRSETTRVVEALTGEARQAYLLRYETAANGLLDEASAERDPIKLAAVARRFPSTEAGRQAVYRLALGRFDRGETLAALASFDLLRPHVEGQQRIDLLVRTAMGYDLLDDAERRDLVLKDLASLEGNLLLGGKSIPTDDREAILAIFNDLKARSGSLDSSDWPVAGGDPTRSSHRSAATGQAVEWTVPALSDPFQTAENAESPLQTQLHRWAAQTALVELAGGRPVVPASRPIAANGSIYFRTPSNLIALDAATGARRWRSLADPLCWDYLAGETPNTSEGDVAGRTFVGQRLWSDATWGTTATDGRVVVAVEETGAAFPLPAVPQPDRPPAHTEPVLPDPFNRLVAYDAATGRRIWETGGPSGGESPWAGTFFLGAPVPVGGPWFVLGEAAGVTHLIAVDISRPDGVSWSQPVAEHDATIDRDAVRRTGGLSPCLAGGLLICPVGSDLVVAVDPATRSLLWAWMSPVPDARERPPFGMPRNGIAPIDVPLRPVEVAASAGNVLIASRQAGLSSVDALDGRIRWTTTEFACLWLIGVDADRAYVQTPTGIVALRLTDGSPAWQTPSLIGPPSGRGVIVGDRLAVPVADASLVMLDAATGRKLETRPTPDHEPLGNLIVVGGSLISQSATRLLALPLDE